MHMLLAGLTRMKTKQGNGPQKWGNARAYLFFRERSGAALLPEGECLPAEMIPSKSHYSNVFTVFFRGLKRTDKETGFPDKTGPRETGFWEVCLDNKPARYASCSDRNKPH